MLSTSFGAAVLAMVSCGVVDESQPERPPTNIVITEERRSVVIVPRNDVLGGRFRATEERERETIHVPRMRLMVEAYNGSTTIIGDEDLERTHITATITAGGQTQEQADDRLHQVALTSAIDNAGTMRVHAKFPDPQMTGDWVDLFVRLPGASMIKAETRNGAVKVAGLESLIVLETRNGAISILDTSGDAHLITRNGAITAEGHDGNVTSTTRNGEIALTGITGKVSAQSRNGAISIALAPEASEPVEVESRNGAVSVTIGREFQGQFSVETSNGSIDVRGDANALRSQEITRRGGTVVINTDRTESRIKTRNGPIQINVASDP